jgi:hypothetical protein
MVDKPILIRRPDWNIRLTHFITWSYLAIDDLTWDTINCGSWVAKAVEVQTDYDLYTDFRGYTDTAVASYKRVKTLGYDSLADYTRDRLPSIPLAFARRGDVVFVPAEGDFEGLGMSHALALADPPHFHAMTLYGLGRGLLSDAVEAFAIGRQS